jgi:hypothetical protein
LILLGVVKAVGVARTGTADAAMSAGLAFRSRGSN